MNRTTVVNALSFDIEDWFHLVGIPAVEDPATWVNLPSLVEERTEWILQCLAEYDIRATFFVLGWIAQRYPKLVQKIDAGGHELGSHAFWHRRIDQMSRTAFADELRQSVDSISQVSGQQVAGFRAPSFSITPGAEWALDVLLDQGLQYDASLFPARRGHGGYPCRQEPHRFAQLPSQRSIPELPMTMLRIGPLRLPFSGGGYLRLLPLTAIVAGFSQLERKGLPTVVYLHPRDFAPNCPRIAMPFHRQLKCYIGLKSTERKLRWLLQNRSFDTCHRVLNAYLDETPDRPAWIDTQDKS